MGSTEIKMGSIRIKVGNSLNHLSKQTWMKWCMGNQHFPHLQTTISCTSQLFPLAPPPTPHPPATSHLYPPPPTPTPLTPAMGKCGGWLAVLWPFECPCNSGKVLGLWFGTKIAGTTAIIWFIFTKVLVFIVPGGGRKRIWLLLSSCPHSAVYLAVL